MPYVYVFIRKDIPLADQIVQASHATLELGSTFKVEANTHLVLLGVKDEVALIAAKDYLNLRGFEVVVFYEPDPIVEGGSPMGYTALACGPVYDEQRKLFRRWRVHNP